MTLSLWFSLLTACLIISFTPGAGAINSMSNGLTVGWRRAGWGVLGQLSGLLAHALIVIAGLGLIVERSPVLFDVIRYTGAAYLLYIGVRMMIPPSTRSRETPRSRFTSHPSTRTGLIARGFWVNMLNPKSILFFLAFMPQFIVPSRPLLTQYLILLATVVIVDTIIMWGFFAGAAKPFQAFRNTPRGERTMNLIFGALFVLVAGLLLFIR